jgi:hypothetical protein
MKQAAECGDVENHPAQRERKQARRGRRAALPVTLDEDRLFDLLNDDWPDDRPRKLYLGGGILGLLHPGGEISIKLKYRYQGKEQQLHLGELGNIPADEILERYRQAKALLQDGIDPCNEIGGDDAEFLALLALARARLDEVNEKLRLIRRRT